MAASVPSKFGLELDAPLPVRGREGISSSVDGGEDRDESDSLMLLWCCGALSAVVMEGTGNGGSPGYEPCKM